MNSAQFIRRNHICAVNTLILLSLDYLLLREIRKEEEKTAEMCSEQIAFKFVTRKKTSLGSRAGMKTLLLVDNKGNSEKSLVDYSSQRALLTSAFESTLIIKARESRTHLDFHTVSLPESKEDICYETTSQEKVQFCMRKPSRRVENV